MDNSEDHRYDCLKSRGHACAPAHTRRQLDEWSEVKENCNVDILEAKRRENPEWRTKGAFKVKCDCCSNAPNTQPTLSHDWEMMRSCPKRLYYESRPLKPSDDQMKLKLKGILERPAPKDLCREGCPTLKYTPFGPVNHWEGIKPDSFYARADKTRPYNQDWNRFRVLDHRESRVRNLVHHKRLAATTTVGPTWVLRGDASPWGQRTFNWNPYDHKREVFPYMAPRDDAPSFFTKFQVDPNQSNSFFNHTNLEHIHIG